MGGLFLIIQIGPKSNHKCPKEGAKGDLVHIEEKAMWPQVKECQQPPEAVRDKD